jgi:plasmid stabilization system protein ParE
MVKRKVIWTKTAVREFDAAIEYIREHSPQNADKVKEQILSKVNQLSDDNVVHRKDPYKVDNDGSFLYFELLKYRIMYHVQPGKVYIIRIRHTSREPKPH